jgi:adenosine deaminase
MFENTATTRKLDMNWFERVPKVELHLHLEGAIPHDALWELVQKYGGDPSVPNLKALERRFEYRDFPHFIETWVWKNGFLREYEDFTLIAEAVARDLAGQNIRYAEAFFLAIRLFPSWPGYSKADRGDPHWSLPGTGG